MPGQIHELSIVEGPRFRHGTTESGVEYIDHEFVVRAKLKEIRNCVLQWWERADHPYVEGMRPNQWTDLFRIAPSSDVFSTWTRELLIAPLAPQDDIRLRDIPGFPLSFGRPRTLLFEIRVKENNAYLPNRQRVIRARQYLNCHPMEERFEVLAENVVEAAAPDDSPPTWS